MKVIIASTIVPFIEGGGTFIIDWLEKILSDRGHQVTTFKIPFSHDHRLVLEQMLALRLLDLSENSDLLITIRTPSYILEHPNKVVWFIHHYRAVYDLWGTEYQGLPNSREMLSFRDAIVHSDNHYLKSAKKIYTNSEIVTRRLLKYNQINAPVLYPPIFESHHYFFEELGDYILFVSRIAHHKRQHLAIESMRYTKTKVKLVVAGNPDSKEDSVFLKKLINEYGLEDKVMLLDYWMSEQEKINLFAKALAGIYIPYDEDSYGYPTLEAFHSHKPVITCNDSGGTIEIILDDENGYVVPPDPKAIAEKMDLLFNNKAKAKSMGENGFDTIELKGIHWDNIVEKLVNENCPG